MNHSTLVASSTRSFRRGARPAFTLVEMLVVIAVIAALMAMLLVGLGAAQRASKKNHQSSDLRQIYVGWMQYASTYDDACMPGYLDEQMQQLWDVSYKVGGKTLSKSNTQTYPWRLYPYLDKSVEPLVRYLEKTEEETRPFNLDGTPNPAGAQLVAENPQFGYNAYYIGGWWYRGTNAATLTFGNSKWFDSEGATHTGSIVATKTTQIRYQDKQLIFCASTMRAVGFYKESADENAAGSAWVVPHSLATTLIWEPSDGSQFRGMTQGASLGAEIGAGLDSLLAQTVTVSGQQGIRVLQQQGVPLRRYGPSVLVLHAGGNIEPTGYGELLDQKRWMSAAWSARDSIKFKHTDD